MAVNGNVEHDEWIATSPGSVYNLMQNIIISV